MATDTDQLDWKTRSAQRIQRRRDAEQARKERKQVEASSTTLNISGPIVGDIVPPTQTVEPPSIPAQSLTPETVTVPIGLLASLQAQLDELKAVKQATGGLTTEQIVTLVQELRKPDAETAEKLAAEKLKREQEKKNMLELALLEEQEKQNREANCGHKKENGRTSFVLGHRGEDGKYKYLCQHCQKIVESTLSPERFGVVTEGRVAFGPGNPLGVYEAQVS